MAGRIRTIKPELIEDAVTSSLSHEAFRLFVGMLILADDHGLLRASPAFLVGQVFHSRETVAPITDLLAELGAKLVTLYSVEGQHYAHVRGWAKHQRISNAAEPRVPLPPGWGVHLYERSEGNRVRKYAKTLPPDDSKKHRESGEVVGAAPLASRDVTGAAPPNYPEVSGAAGSPISDLRSPTTEGEGAAPTAATTHPHPPMGLSATATEIAHFSDLWPSLPASALESAAARVVRSVAMEPKCKRDSLDAAAVVRMALPRVREWAAGLTHATEAQRLARVETEASWVLDRVRKDWHRVAQAKPGAAPGQRWPRTGDPIDHEQASKDLLDDAKASAKAIALADANRASAEAEADREAARKRAADRRPQTSPETVPFLAQIRKAGGA